MGETQFHFIKDEKLRETLTWAGVALGIVGVIVAILSFIL